MKKQKQRLVGVRSWRATKDGELRSLHHSTVWDPSEAEMQAGCHTTHTKGAPESKCTCGFYAFYNFGLWAKEEERYGGTSLTRALSWYMPSGFDARKMVVGIISVSGRVVLARDGFRAQKARVEAILDYKTDYEILGEMLSSRWIVDGIAKKYDVPVISLDEAEAFCMVEGLQIRDQMDGKELSK